MLPKNTTAHLQPMDAGIIKNFKLNYRKQLVNDYMSSLDASIEGFTIDLKRAVLMISHAWQNVKKETIKNCALQ